MLRLGLKVDQLFRCTSGRYLSTERRGKGFETFDSIESFRAKRCQIPRHETIGFVPTMGGIHEGHLSLVRQARNECDVVIASVFVNPAQFSPSEDLDQYPRPIAQDLNLLQQEGVDFVFTPTTSTMYSKSDRTFVEPAGFCGIAEGKARPQFFRGVQTVVAKLFNIVEPTDVYFGQKDAAQCVAIHRLISDLCYPIQLHIVETSREADGLAMSTRNLYLSKEERAAASVIFQGLEKAKEYYRVMTDKHVPAKEIATLIEQEYKTEPMITNIEYISIASNETMEELEYVMKGGNTVISVAVRLGNSRLIDNIVLS